MRREAVAVARSIRESCSRDECASDKAILKTIRARSQEHHQLQSGSLTLWEFPPPPLIRDFSVKKHGGDAPQNQKRCARLRGCPSAARKGRAGVGFSGAWHAPDWSRWCQKFRQHG